MRRLLPAALVLTALLSPVVEPAARPAQAATGSTAAQLRAAVEQALVGATASTVGVAVDVDGLGPVVRRNFTARTRPASTEKLYTAFAALSVLGPDTRLRTELRTRAATVSGRLSGDLFLVAGGDPFFSRSALRTMAQKVRAAGIVRIGGQLVVDDTRYDRVRQGPYWYSTWVPQESGPLSAMALDRNAWSRSTAYLADPATAVLPVLRSYLADAGVTVALAGYRREVVPAGTRLVSAATSVPVRDLARRTLQLSDNFAAELLLKEVGKVARGAGTTATGALAVRTLLDRLRVPYATIADGSGLSTLNRATAASESALLAAAERSPVYAPFRSALPVACRDGTLADRMCGTAAQNRLAAKTGTLDGTRALTGWTTTRDGRRVRFAFLLSGVGDGTEARKAIDRAAAVLAGADVAE